MAHSFASKCATKNTALGTTKDTKEYGVFPSFVSFRVPGWIIFPTLLLLLAAGFRSWQWLDIPPGPHHDAIINGQIVQEFIWPAWPEWLRPPKAAPFIPWLTIQQNPRGPDLQEHAWLYQTTLAVSMSLLGRNPVGMRWVDFAWAMLGVSACCALARRLFGRRAAWAALALQAVSFWSVFIGRAGIRPVTIVPLLALAGCLFWDAWRSPRLAWGRYTLAGGLAGLAFYGYLSARPMLLVFLAFALYLAVMRVPGVQWKRLAVGCAALLATAALVAAPLLLYQAAHPETNLRVDMLSDSLKELAAGRPGVVLQAALATLGMFFWRGDMQEQYNAAGRPVFDPIGGLFFLVGLGVAVWQWRRPVHVFALLWLAVGLLPGVLSQPAPHTLRTVAAQVVVYGLAGYGAVALGQAAQQCVRGQTWSRSFFSYHQVKSPSTPSVQKPMAWCSLRLGDFVVKTKHLVDGYLEMRRFPVVIWSVWFLFFAVWNYRGYFIQWPASDEARLLYQAELMPVVRYLDRDADTTPTAICSTFPVVEFEDFFRSPRQTLPFVMRRKDLPIRWFDCRNALVFPAGGQARLIFPGIAYTNTLDSALQPWIKASVPVDNDRLPDGTVYRVDVARSLADELAAVASSAAWWGPESRVSGAARLPVDFGHAVELLGYRVEQAQRRPGNEVRVLTYWRVTQPPPMFMSGFMHLLSDPTHIVAQHDQWAILYDTLLPGDVFAQLYVFTLPDDTPPGAYRLSLGWYILPSQPRLPVYEGNDPRGDRLMLQEIMVRP